MCQQFCGLRVAVTFSLASCYTEDMSKIEFYFDPACPFSWITSRWLLQVRAERDIDISWRQFSLALKNDSLVERDDESPHAADHRASHRIQRVIYQAVSQHQASAIDLYSEFGIRHHIIERAFDEAMIAEVLADKQLPAELAEAADDTSLDQPLRAEIDSAMEAAGGDIGVPTIVFSASDGHKLGYFGPVLNELPDTLDESLAIWDGLAKLATVKSFYELKRGRDGGPNVFSAARC